uniref:Arf-GAP domain-containing protein n=1 Tax=Ananas comosus var. bracteatus TaxID=296719 RepID=A0A6V7PQK0_ANACO|nr:unnamed protein product [Ananas comosus var. bracteatus]
MSSSKKAEERNEKIIRGLLKLPPNRKCINCNSSGPQYVCTSFWTFICLTCSGVHREFSHRVKSVSLSTFTNQEVEALQRGGNQRAREIFLKDWDSQMRLPDSSKIDKLREFIKNVYVDKKYAGGDPPISLLETRRNHEEHRRASSYHSYSQSPPYEYQYEERRYGKQTGMLSRKPGSDRGNYEGKISSFIYSPGSQRDQNYEDRFANESCGSRNSDYSVSSCGDPFRVDAQSPNFQEAGYSSPPSQQVRDILIDNARPHTTISYSQSTVKSESNGIHLSQRTASSGSFGSFDSTSPKSANSGSLFDTALEPEHASVTQKNESSAASLSFPKLPSAADATSQDLFNPSVGKQPLSSSDPPVDLFANINSHPSSTLSVENLGWATFDSPPKVPTLEVNKPLPSTLPSPEEKPKGNGSLFPQMPNNSPWFSATVAHDPFPGLSNGGSHEVKGSTETTNSESWKAFDDTSVGGLTTFPGTLPQTLSGSHDDKLSDNTNYNSQSWNTFDDLGKSIPQNLSWTLPHVSEIQTSVSMPQATNNPFTGNNVAEVSSKDAFQKLSLDQFAAFSAPFDVVGDSFPSSAVPSVAGSTREQKSTNPFDLPFDSDLEADNMFMDMSSLKEALPDPELPAAFLDNLSETWFPQNSITTYIPSVPQGGLAYLAGPVSGAQLPNITSQAAVASLGGNPFA